MTAKGADWSGDWVVNEMAARVDRAGPRPVSEDHKPGLVPPDVDWLINELVKINSEGRSDNVIVQHAREIAYRLTALRARELGPLNLAGSIKDGFTTSKRTTESEGPASELERLERAALSGPTRWIKAWSATSLEVRRLIWRPEWGPVVRQYRDLHADETGPRKVGFTRAKPQDLGIEGSALIGPRPEDVLHEIRRVRRELEVAPAADRQGNKSNGEAKALANIVRAAVVDLCGRRTVTDNRHTGETTGPLADFGAAFDDRFRTHIRWRLIDQAK
ncbi:hypothetical protein [Bradyrhizobium australiense]|uniref:Uncharacterized protein n=1 Tax=Bradyrhizobium australiense TaxID=2721161 RepID=A0A7Y4GRJ4_9BRAD|nr:hypothetical protein [Bradyrhizobium australiense]NOJ40313.1 hypothetical protein [Bradyrhizobium australiense]